MTGTSAISTASGTPPSTGAGHDAWTGEAYPLGATATAEGTNFAVFSRVAERVELCLEHAEVGAGGWGEGGPGPRNA